MKKRRLKFGVAVLPVFAAILVADCFGAEASSEPQTVWAMPGKSLHWKTITSAFRPVALEWPEGSVSALLTIATDGAVVAQTNITDVAASEVMVMPTVFHAEYAAERVLAVSVKYLDSDNAEIASDSAQIGWVTGVNGNRTRLIPSASGKYWTRAVKYAVLPIPEGTTAFSVNSAAQSYDAPGWWEWRIAFSGDYALSLTASGEEFLAMIAGYGGGFVFVVR